MSVFNRVSVDSVKADIVKNEIKITLSLGMTDENLVVAKEVAAIFDEDTRAKVVITVQGEHQTTFVDANTGEVLPNNSPTVIGA